jgi:arylsulfatase A
LADDLGYGDLACYGHPAIRTPHLDRLAAEGIRLTACYAAAPVCSPSRAGLLCGLTPSRMGIYDWIPAGHAMHLRRHQTTVATLLRPAGYNTCQVGKWHLNGQFNSRRQPQPHDHGFEHWFATQNNAAPSHSNPVNFVRNGREVGQLDGYSCQVAASEAIRWLREERDPARPFFLFVAFHEPHEPVASPPDLVAQYAASTEDPRQAEYFANVANLDSAVGRITAALDDLQLADRTLVWFTSDNGPETRDRYRGAERSCGSAGPWRGRKLHLYEGGIRVPGIVRWPGHIQPGTESDEPVCGVDVLPTFCEIAGVPAGLSRDAATEEPPAGNVRTEDVLDGTSVVPLLEGRAFTRSRPLFWHYYRSLGGPRASMRVGDYVVLGLWDAGDIAAGASVQPGDVTQIKSAKLTRFELYNLHDDPAQEHDLAAAEPDKLRELSAALVERYEQVVAEGCDWLPAESR